MTFIAITPMGKPRMTQRDRWKNRPVVTRYYSFCDELRLKFPTQLSDCIELTFYIAMPNSWPERKKRLFAESPHQQKPDIDNLSKAVMDALCKDDAYIYKLTASKYWAREPGIDIMI